MPQTRFVLRKALALEKKVIVVVNKIDRPAARQGHPALLLILIRCHAKPLVYGSIHIPYVYILNIQGARQDRISYARMRLQAGLCD